MQIYVLMREKVYLAVDLGAESGRVMAGNPVQRTGGSPLTTKWEQIILFNLQTNPPFLKSNFPGSGHQKRLACQRPMIYY